VELFLLLIPEVTLSNFGPEASYPDVYEYIKTDHSVFLSYYLQFIIHNCPNIQRYTTHATGTTPISNARTSQSLSNYILAADVKHDDWIEVAQREDLLRCVVSSLTRS